MNYPNLKTPVAILNAALKKEYSARDFYAELANRCHVEFVQDLLRRLQNEEEKHVTLIRNMLARIAAGHNPA